MKLFDRIGLKNFRVFDNTHGTLLELAGINLLTGSNSSGKSSVIKAMQLLHKSIAADKVPFDLDLNDQEHLLGDFENVLSNPDDKNIEISVPFPFLGITHFYARLSYQIPQQIGSYKAHLTKIVIVDKSDDSVLFSFGYTEATLEEIATDLSAYENEKLAHEQQNKELGNLSQIQKFMGAYSYLAPHSELAAYISWKINVPKIRAYLTSILPFYEMYLDKSDKEHFLSHCDNHAEETALVASILIKALKSDKLKESWSDFLQMIQDDDMLEGKYPVREGHFDPGEYFRVPYTIEEVLFHYSSVILEENLLWKNSSASDESIIGQCFKSAYAELVKKIADIHYLSTVKEENSRIYMGTKNSPFINLLKDYSVLKPDEVFINKYLEAFEIGSKIVVDYEPKYQTIKVSITSGKLPPRDLVDFGYGIKQLILILMQITVLSEKKFRQKESHTHDGSYYEDYYLPSLLLVEEPETNLHPKWQSKLAEMFAEAYKLYDIQFIIETHSEYLIRKFQTLTAEKEIKNTPVKIFYLRGPNDMEPGKKQLETTMIEKDGSIDFAIFDGGFFDVGHKLEFSLLNIRRDHFLTDFEKLKNSQKKDGAKIIELQDKIDAFTEKTNLNSYELSIRRTFDTSKMHPHSIAYLTSGLYLFNITDPQSDFSPVILQYARAVENELSSLFNTAVAKDWMLGQMQGSLEFFQSGSTGISRCSNAEMPLVAAALNTAFNTPVNLKIGLLQDLRVKRNDAAHPGVAKNRNEATAYIALANGFIEKWVELKR